MRSGRERRIERIKQRLLRKSMPRLIVTLILSMTAMSAFLTSFGLLRLGVLRMWLRYPVAIVVAYLFFLLLLAVWLWLRRRTAELDVDALELVHTDLGPSHHHEGFGGAGDFGGAGIGGDWTSSVASASQSGISGGGEDPHCPTEYRVLIWTKAVCPLSRSSWPPLPSLPASSLPSTLSTSLPPC